MYTDIPTTYEDMIWNAKLSFTKNEDLLKVIRNVAVDNWLDAEATWALEECFLQK
jgi:hypothetical protein